MEGGRSRWKWGGGNTADDFLFLLLLLIPRPTFLVFLFFSFSFHRPPPFSSNPLSQPATPSHPFSVLKVVFISIAQRFVSFLVENGFSHTNWLFHFRYWAANGNRTWAAFSLVSAHPPPAPPPRSTGSNSNFPRHIFKTWKCTQKGREEGVRVGKDGKEAKEAKERMRGWAGRIW